MSKLIATICVISWSGFWAFGYLALSAGIESQAQVVTAFILAALGFFSGIFTYLHLARTADPDRVRHVRQSEV